MDKSTFSQLLYQTSFDNTATVEAAIRYLAPLRTWIKENVPKKLFRYRKNTPYNIDSIKNDEIWGSTILECNDPYECTPCYDTEKFQVFLQQMYSSDALQHTLALVKEGKVPPEIRRFFPPNALDTLIQVLQKHSEENVAKELLLESLEPLDKLKANWHSIINSFFMGIRQVESQTHIACFSESCDSSLMWRHYADSHKGFCLEYDFGSVLQDCPMNCSNPALCNSFMLNLPIAPVTYSDHRFDATSYLPSVIQGYFQSPSNNPVDVYLLDVLLLAKCQLLKSSDWAYEQEWRLANRSSSDTYVPHRCIAKVKPSGVYLGSRMAEADKTLIYEICQNRGIPCYTMLQNYVGKDYTLQIQPYEEFLKSIHG